MGAGLRRQDIGVVARLRSTSRMADTELAARPGADAPGESIPGHARTLGADLIIKGAYTQSRLRQMIFGGATTHLINETTIPVFMAH